MPIIAIGAAIAASVVAGVGVAGAIAGTVTALTATLEVVTAVGATISAVGAVTGNKALTLAGAGLGLVGGIGAIASGAGVFGSVSAGGGTGGTAADAAAATAPDAAAGTSGDVIDNFAGNAVLGGGGEVDTGAFDAGDMAAAPAAATGTAAAYPPPQDSGTPFVGMENTQPGGPAAGAASQNVIGQGPSTGPQPTTGTAAPTQGTPMPPAITQGANAQAAGGQPFSVDADGTITYGGAPGATNANQAIVNQLGATTAPGLGSTASTSSGLPGVLGNIVDFVGDHQVLGYGLLQAGGQLLTPFSAQSQATVNQLNAQAAANQANANLTTQQTQNMAQPKTVANLSSPVTGTPNNIITPPTAGLMNSGAPQVNVTGAPVTAAA